MRGLAVPLRHAQVVLQRVIRSSERVVELITFEEIIVTSRLVARTVLRIDGTTHRPERALLALDPDHDGLLGPRVVDTADDSFGKAALR
jgi:hypothetical protein